MSGIIYSMTDPHVKFVGWAQKNIIHFSISAPVFGKQTTQEWWSKHPSCPQNRKGIDPGAHTGRVEAKDGNIIETQRLNIESKHQLKAHCAII